MRKKKTGVAIICGVLFITLGTGLAFAANANASTPQTNITATENTDGSIDPSGTLIGLEPYSQAEFNARDIDKLKNSSQASSVMYYDGSDISTQPTSVNGAFEEGMMTPDELANEYAIYEPFGLTYDKNTDSFYHNGKLVRQFFDIMATNGEDLSGGNFSGTIRQLVNDNGEIDVYTVRDFTNIDINGYGRLTGIEVGD